MGRVSASQVPAARNALKILSLLADNDVPISAARIRAELDLPRSSTYHLLNELMAEGFIVRIPENKTYGLGLAAYSMASAYTKQQPLVRFARKHLDAAARLVGGSGHLSRLAGSEIVYLQEVRSPRAVSLVTEVGVRLQAARTASGRIMLAHVPEPEAKAAFSTSGATSSWREFRELLDVSRARGWGEENEEVSRGQSSVAVAIHDHLGRPAAALAVTFPASTPQGVRAEAVAALDEAAGTVSEKMYGQDTRPRRAESGD